MEDAFYIKGGKRLSGEIKLSGAKNVALKVIIAALLFDQEIILHNIPKIVDVIELLHLITELGGKASFVDTNTVLIDGRSLSANRVDLLHASKIRVSFMMFAPLLKKFDHCFVPNPGGCRIGARPIDRTIEGMKKLGIKIEYDSETGYYEATLKDKLSGSYTFSKPSHTGTELLILLSLFAKSKVVLENAAQEPEIDDLVRFLNLGGAKVRRESKKIIIEPIQRLQLDKPFAIMPDRNEAVTFATLACATGGEITLTEISHPLLESFLSKLRSAHVTIKNMGPSKLQFIAEGKLISTKVETAPHPGFMTDWQPNWAVLMTQAQGESFIYERVFENRFSYVDELRKLGAEIDFVKSISVNPHEYFFFNFDPARKYNQAIRIKGPQELHGGVLNITDLRAGATLAIAALVADGESVINGASILERGYEDFVGKVQSLGGYIKKE